MKISPILLFCLLMSLPTQAQYVFDYTNFSKAPLVMLEEASYKKDKFVVLTPSEAGKRGGLWHEKKVKVRHGFSTSFSFRMRDGGVDFDSDQKGADGIAFVIHNNPTATGVGNHGGGIGFDGIPNSIAIEFDNWRNDEWGEPNDNHVALHTLGTAPNSSGTSSLKVMNSNLPTQLENGEIHQVRIEYEKGVIKVFLNEKQVLNHTIDIGKTLNLDNETAWIGFTSSTGAAYASQEIHTWQFKGETLPPPAVKEPEPEPKKPTTLENRVVVGKKVIKVHNPKITLQVWDKGIEDGDIISLNLNKTWVLENYALKKNKKSIEVNLNEGENFLVLHALNLGRVPPNTVILTVVDGKKTHQTLLNSNMKASDSIEIRYEPK
jgi:Bacterial lectin